MDIDTANCFRREFKVSSQAPMRGSDKKKLRKELASVFPRLNEPIEGDEESALDVLLPPRDEIMASKLSNRTIVYTLKDGPPLFIDVDGKRHFLPSLIVMWKIPDILPALYIPPHVSSYLIGTGGADLMLPGVTVPKDGLGELKYGAPSAIRVIGNPLPIGVGLLTMNNEVVEVSGGKGKILRIVHCHRDTLWTYGHMGVPNEGFAFRDSVRSIEVEVDQVAEGVDAMKIQEDEGESAVQSLEVDTNVMDAELEKAIVRALQTKVKDDELPISQSQLWERIYACASEGVKLDAKKSSYKTIARFLGTMSRRKLIRSKEDKKRGEMKVTAVTRTHELLTGDAGEEVSVVSAVSSKDKGPETQKQLQILEMYRPTAVIKVFFGDDAQDVNEFFTMPTCRNYLKAYIEKNTLIVRGDPKYIMVDQILAAALFKKKRDGDPPRTITREDAFHRFIGNLKAYHAIVPVDTPMEHIELKKGGVTPVKVLSEVRTGRKHTTHVNGLDIYGIEPELLAREAQRKFACSCAASEVPGRPDLKEVVIQGNVAFEMGELLEKQYGIPRRLIEIVEKDKKKKKK